MRLRRVVLRLASLLIARRAALMFVGVVLSPPCPAEAQLPSVAPPSAVDTSIQALFAAFDARWNARDAAGMAALHTADTDVWIRGQPRLRGQAAVRETYGRSFAASAPPRHRTVVAETALIAPGVAVAEGRILLETTRGDSTVVLRRLAFVSVVTKPSGGWQVRLVRASPEQAASSTAPPSGSPH